MATSEEIAAKFEKLAHYFSNEKQQHAVMMISAYMTYCIKRAEAHIPYYIGMSLSGIADTLVNESPDDDDDSAEENSTIALAILDQAKTSLEEFQTLISENDKTGDEVYKLMEQIEAFYND